MKNILYLIICFSLLGYSQESSNESVNDRSGLSYKFGVNLVDSTGEWGPFNTLSSTEEMAFSTPFEIGLEYRLNDLMAVGLDGSINKWKAGEGVIDNAVVANDLKYFAVDAKFKLFLDEALDIFTDWDWFELYVDGGLGYFSIKNDLTGATFDNMSGNIGIGANAWVTDNIALYIDGTSKFALSKFQSPNSNHFQYAVGAMLNFGESLDSDNDGIKDSKDACPFKFGLKSDNGCPPSTKDDKVKEDVDTDGDGIIDEFDKCPEVRGVASNEGCPDMDTDGDGVMDSLDKCPTSPNKTFDGCPNQDIDNDGLLNEADSCPEQWGPHRNEGCPETVIPEDISLSNVYFEVNSYVVRPRYFKVLNDNAKYILSKPNIEYIIIGHTDSSGNESYNRTLSENRAKAVIEYLVKKGVPEEILSVESKASSEPESKKKTQQAKALNRRVQVVSRKI